MKQKIALFGRMGCGKSELGSRLGYQRVSWGDAVKAGVIEYGLIPSDVIDKSRDRPTLQMFGQFRRGEIPRIEANGKVLTNFEGNAYLEKPPFRSLTPIGLCYADYWVEQAMVAIRQLSEEGKPVLNDDIRRWNEWNALKALNFVMIKVHADEEIRLERMRQRDGGVDISTLNDISESEIDELPYDHLIVNNDTIESAWRSLLDVIS